MLSDQQIKKFQEIYEKHFGEKIDTKEANKKGLRLIRLAKAVIEPDKKTIQ